jgi:hypothetical protein
MGILFMLGVLGIRQGLWGEVIRRTTASARVAPATAERRMEA